MGLWREGFKEVMDGPAAGGLPIPKHTIDGCPDADSIPLNPRNTLHAYSLKSLSFRCRTQCGLQSTRHPRHLGVFLQKGGRPTEKVGVQGMDGHCQWRGTPSSVLRPPPARSATSAFGRRTGLHDINPDAPGRHLADPRTSPLGDCLARNRLIFQLAVAPTVDDTVMQRKSGDASAKELAVLFQRPPFRNTKK